MSRVNCCCNCDSAVINLFIQVIVIIVIEVCVIIVILLGIRVGLIDIFNYYDKHAFSV